MVPLAMRNEHIERGALTLEVRAESRFGGRVGAGQLLEVGETSHELEDPADVDRLGGTDRQGFRVYGQDPVSD
jgi:hypothetical protein